MIETAQAPQTVEGTWEEIAAQAERYSGKRVRLQVLGDAASSENGEASPKPAHVRATFGRYPQLNQLTDKDFTSAEWRGEGLGDP